MKAGLDRTGNPIWFSEKSRISEAAMRLNLARRPGGRRRDGGPLSLKGGRGSALEHARRDHDGQHAEGASGKAEPGRDSSAAAVWPRLPLPSQRTKETRDEHGADETGGTDYAASISSKVTATAVGTHPSIQAVLSSRL